VKLRYWCSLRLDHKKPLFYIGEWVDKHIGSTLSSEKLYLLSIILKVDDKESKTTNWTIDLLTTEKWSHCFSFKTLLIDRPYQALVLFHIGLSVIDLLADPNAVVLHSVYLYQMAQSALHVVVCLYVGCHSSLSWCLVFAGPQITSVGANYDRMDYEDAQNGVCFHLFLMFL